MKLALHVKGIEVFYDGRCGMCCTFHEWIHRQARAFAIDFVPYQSVRAVEVFPEVHELDPAREMVVRVDRERVFRGAEAWVWCLYGCVNYRGVARRLAKPMMLGVAVRFCRLLAANRRGLSRVFFRKKDREVRNQLHQMDPPSCDEGGCDLERDEWRDELIK